MKNLEDCEKNEKSALEYVMVFHKVFQHCARENPGKPLYAQLELESDGDGEITVFIFEGELKGVFCKSLSNPLVFEQVFKNASASTTSTDSFVLVFEVADPAGSRISHGVVTIFNGVPQNAPGSEEEN
jgi:hypothetical protein